jgi:hypothetical protein
LFAPSISNVTSSPPSVHFNRFQGCQMVYFKTKHPNLGICILVGHRMENVGIFYDFTAISYMFWPIGVVWVLWYIFPRLGMFGPRKIWQPWPVNRFFFRSELFRENLKTNPSPKIRLPRILIGTSDIRSGPLLTQRVSVVKKYTCTYLHR